MSTINTTIETSVDALIKVVVEKRPSFSKENQAALKAAILASPQPEALMADLRKAYRKKTLGRAIDRILAPKPVPEPTPKPQTERPWEPEKFKKWAMEALHNKPGFGRDNTEAVVAEVLARVAAGTLTPACVRANVNSPEFFRAIVTDIKVPEPTLVEDSYEDDDGWDEDFFRDLVKDGVGDGEKVFGRKLTHDEAGRLAEAVSEMGDWAQDSANVGLLAVRLRSHFHRLKAKFRVGRGGRVKMDLWMNPRSVKSVAKYFTKAKIAANPEILVRAVMEGWISEEEVLYKTIMRHREWFVENFGSQHVVS